MREGYVSQTQPVLAQRSVYTRQMLELLASCFCWRQSPRLELGEAQYKSIGADVHNVSREDADRCFTQSKEPGDVDVYLTVIIFVDRGNVAQIRAVPAVNGAADPALVRESRAACDFLVGPCVAEFNAISRAAGESCQDCRHPNPPHRKFPGILHN